MTRSSLGARDRALLKNARRIIGIDEVGRGCLAGPVVVCGVAFRRIPSNPLVRDSKRLSHRQRVVAAEWIRASCDGWLLTEVWVELIDRVNILEATRLAMSATARALSSAGSVLVVDYVEPSDVPCPVYASPAADDAFFSVAAASIVAKVHRDHIMTDLDRRYPSWSWKNNKGYGTREHRLALQRSGTSFLHRKSFGWSPVLP
jgi:ribonuclease HII